MSDDLSKVVDKFFVSTGIQNHNYGIPSIKNASLSSQRDIFPKELKYTNSYQELTTKLNRLIYLNEMKQLNSEFSSTIEDKYQSIVNDEQFGFGDTNDYDNIINFFTIQNNFIKTNKLLNEYLQVTLPILRSIHHIETEITTSEANLSKNLSILFSSLNLELTSNINRLMKEYNDNNQLERELIRLRVESDKVLQQLRPKLMKINELNNQITQLKSTLNERKLDNIINSSLNETNLRKEFMKLVDHWNRIAILTDFLPSFIMTLPINWYDTEVTKDIIDQCGTIATEINDYRQKITNVDDMNINDLLMIEL